MSMLKSMNQAAVCNQSMALKESFFLLHVWLLNLSEIKDRSRPLVEYLFTCD